MQDIFGRGVLTGRIRMDIVSSCCESLVCRESPRRLQNMRIFCVLLLAALSSFSAVQAQEQRDYFPLQVGNTWTYERKVLTWSGERYVYVLDYVSLIITHTEELEGNTYYVFSDGRAYRKSPDGHVLEYQDGKEFLLYDLSPGEDPPELGYELPASYRGVGIMMTIQGGGFIWRSIISDLDSVIVPVGKFGGYLFSYSSVNERDFVICLAPSLGIVYYRVHDVLGGQDVILLSLVNATVNGKQYGISTVNPSSWGKIKSLSK